MIDVIAFPSKMPKHLGQFFQTHEFSAFSHPRP